MMKAHTLWWILSDLMRALCVLASLWDWCVMRGTGRPAVTILAQCDSRIRLSSLSTICPFSNYINNQKRLINFPPDATQQLLTSPKKEKSLPSHPPLCSFPLCLSVPLPTNFHSLLRTKRCALWSCQSDANVPFKLFLWMPSLFSNSALQTVFMCAAHPFCLKTYKPTT